MSLEVLTLAKVRRNFLLDELSQQRLNKLSGRLPGKTDTDILKDALGHYLGSIERDQPVWVTAPSEIQKAKHPDHNGGDRER